MRRASDERAQQSSPAVQAAIGAAERLLYAAIGLLLVLSAGLLLFDTIKGVFEAADERPVADLGLFVLERLLLLFIIAELLFTLRIIDFGGRILVEPFLLIGMIAVVRRVLVITAEMEAQPDHREVTDFLIELGALGGLALVLAVATYLLRARPASPPAQ